MRSALLPLSIQGGCCRSREPTVWDQVIAWSVYARRENRIDPANLFPAASRFAIASAILRPRAAHGYAVVTGGTGFQSPTFSAPTMTPSAMSVRRDRPRHYLPRAK